jgi:hypothetical protein
MWGSASFFTHRTGEEPLFSTICKAAISHHIRATFPLRELAHFPHAIHKALPIQTLKIKIQQALNSISQNPYGLTKRISYRFLVIC